MFSFSENKAFYTFFIRHNLLLLRSFFKVHSRKAILNIIVSTICVFSSPLLHAEDCQSPEPLIAGDSYPFYPTRAEAVEATWCQARNKLAELIAEGRLYHGQSMNRPIDWVRVEEHTNRSGEKVFKTCPFISVGTGKYRSAHPYAKAGYRVYGCTSSLGHGTFIDRNHYKESTACKFPYSSIASECAAYCPDDKPELDLATGSCFSDKETEEPEDTCELNPVIMATGEKIETVHDITINSPFPIVISRTYRSNRSREAQLLQAKQYSALASSATLPQGAGMVKHVQPSSYNGAKVSIGRNPYGIPQKGHKNWEFTSFPQLTDYDSSVKVTFNGNNVVFDKVAHGIYIARNQHKATLKRDSSNSITPWVVTLENGERLFFTSSRRLSKRTNVTGQSHSYSASTASKEGSFYTVTDDFSNAVKITNNRLGALIRIEASNGITINYGYEHTSSNLTSVKKSSPIDPANPNSVIELTTTYHYENTAFPYALTGITDEKGVRYATWMYDDFGRVIQSTHADNVDNGTVSYTDKVTTVTNSLGKQTKYHYDMVSDAKRLVKVEGVATASCAAANQAYTYYPAGQVKTQTDWEGNVTYFEYNSQGQVTKHSEGYGTPEVYTVDTIWHETLNKPSVISHPDKQEQFKYNAQGKLINKSVIAF